MCSGSILLVRMSSTIANDQYKIPRVVVGENKTFLGEEAWLASRGVEVIVAEDKTCYNLMQEFIKQHPEEWNEDIGEE